MLPVWFVYVLMAPAGTGRSHFKIGITSEPLRRPKQVQTSCPLKITQVLFLDVHSEVVARRIEAKLHGQFASYRTAGEWFAFKTDDAEDKAAFNDGARKVLDPEVGAGWQWTRLTMDEIREALALETAVRSEWRRLSRSAAAKRRAIDMMSFKGVAHVASRRKYG